MRNASFDAVIAGAGLAGRLSAWRLARAGWRVSLRDRAQRDDPHSASAVAAAMLSPIAELAVADAAVFELALRSMALWPQWLAELEADSGCSVYFRRAGTLVLAHALDGGSLDHFERLLCHKLPAEQQARLQRLDAQALASAEPALAGRFQRGLLLHGEGQLANDELLAALGVALDRLKVDWREGEPADPFALAAEMARGDAAHQGVVIDTRGVAARADWPGLRGVRGELIAVECAGIRLQRPVRLMHPRYQLYVAPRPGNRFVVGATELESEDSGPPTLRSVLELASALHSLHPAFGEARVIGMAAALRPAFDDHCPALRHHRGLWQLNGLYRHGYLCAPALVDQLVWELFR